jgi:hypothetical protein
MAVENHIFYNLFSDEKFNTERSLFHVAGSLFYIFFGLPLGFLDFLASRSAGNFLNCTWFFHDFQPRSYFPRHFLETGGTHGPGGGWKFASRKGV